MRPIRLWGNKKLRFALIGVAVVVLVAAGWLVWPEPPIKMRLALVRSEIVDGNRKLLFRIEGAEQYEVCIAGFWYVANDKISSSNSVFAFTNQSPIWGRLFFVIPPPYNPNAKAWRLQTDIGVCSPDKNNPRKAVRVIKDAWDASSGDRFSYFSTAKAYWQDKAMRLISEQTLTSELITNEQTLTTQLITNTPPH